MRERHKILIYLNITSVKILSLLILYEGILILPDI